MSLLYSCYFLTDSKITDQKGRLAIYIGVTLPFLLQHNKESTYYNLTSCTFSANIQIYLECDQSNRSDQYDQSDRNNQGDQNDQSLSK